MHFIEEQVSGEVEGQVKEPSRTPHSSESPASTNKRSSSRGSNKPDPNIVLTHMNKSVFDDTGMIVLKYYILNCYIFWLMVCEP